MITIQFQNKKDGIYIYEKIKKIDPQQNIHLHIKQNTYALLKILSPSTKVIVNTLIPVLTHYIIHKVEIQWMKEMIHQFYYYCDKEEQDQILMIARSILDGEKVELKNVYTLKDMQPRELIIRQALSDLLTNSISFSFESFLQFRLKHYKEQLRLYVESAIDEYQMEQEYQNFIENLRTYVATKKSEMETIHVVHNQDFAMYDGNKNKLEKEKIKALIDQSVLEIATIDPESLVIAPLVSIAPTRIYIYSNEVNHGVIQTIQNIFLERVVILPTNQFYYAPPANHNSLTT